MALLSGPRMPPRAGGQPRQLVVLLHGVGANGDDLIELAPVLAAVLPGAAFVAPNAPEACDMAPFGYQWFSLRDRRRTRCCSASRRQHPWSMRSSTPSSNAIGWRIINWHSSVFRKAP